MESNTEGNLLEIMDLARTLRQEQLFIQQEQAAFAQLTETLTESSASITKLAYICAQQRQNLNDLIISRPETGPIICCRRASCYENAKFIDAKKILDYEHAIAYEELFNHLYRSPYLLALSLATADRIVEITPHHLSNVIHFITRGLFGNAINSKDVEMLLKLLRELIEIQVIVSDNPRRCLRANASVFARLYHRLNESMFSAKIFLTAALYEPIMSVLSETDTILDVDPAKVIESFTTKERLRRFGADTAPDYNDNVEKFRVETLEKLYALAMSFIDSLCNNWSLFPSTLRWLIQTMSHHLKQAHFNDKVINEVLSDMVFTHFICPAIVSPDLGGIIDAPISEEVRFNLIQIGQIIQMLALARHEGVEAKFVQVFAKFKANRVTQLIDLLLVSQTGEDVVAILSQQSDFERMQLLSSQNELCYFVEFFRILLMHEEYEIMPEDRQKLEKILAHLPESQEACQRYLAGATDHLANTASGDMSQVKERSKQALLNLGKATKSKIAKSMSFSNSHFNGGNIVDDNVASVCNAVNNLNLMVDAGASNVASNNSSVHSSPSRQTTNGMAEGIEQEPILIFNVYNGDEHNKFQPLTEEEVLNMNCIGEEIANRDDLLVEGAESINMESTIDKSSLANGYDGISDEMLRPLKNSHHARFSISHDDASIGNSDNLEVVSEAPSNHSVSSSLELEENQLDQNDNLSDMVSANVSGRGTPNVSGRDTPSSQVTDGESVTNALPTPQMQKLLSKARSDIEDKFCKFELKKFEGDETVSIISDTWSTDVLASDSETVEAGDRDRDRNFSTPLIPSSVILPGDNNFDPARSSAYLDASDQRSESNWSTDVLASDSEKLAEVDTDDNASITARSDIVDGSNGRLDIELSNPRRSVPDSPLYGIGSTVRRQRSHHQAPAANTRNSAARIVSTSNAANGPTNNRAILEPRAGHVSSGSSGGNASDRSQEDSAFYDAINLYDETAAAAVGNADNNVALGHGYEELSSLARSSVRTNNQLSGENSFQQNYKSTSCAAEDKAAFLDTSRQRMRRQISAESSISSQSLNLDEAATLPAAQQKDVLRKNRQFVSKNGELSGSKDLIDFRDFDASLPTDFNMYSDDGVVHRPTSYEQRSAGVDGRRNGILAVRSNGDTESTNATGSRVYRRHQSLNYENHEIMLSNVVAPRRTSALPNLKGSTDDEKTFLLQQQRDENLGQELKMEDFVNFQAPEEPASSGIMSSPRPPTKSTGAIPKSISFDASADKNSTTASATSAFAVSSARALTQRGARMAAALGGENGTHSGIFNKLKQGFFRHKRTNKSLHQRNNASEFGGTSSALRSVSFNTANNNGTLELLNGSQEMSEDILEKYRSKVATSSENKNAEATNGLPAIEIPGDGDINANGICRSSVNNSHDKTINFNIVKRKIRTVLSKTDLHTGDFRHTTLPNVSPLLTYLQIQKAQSINVQNFQQISFVAEAIRCISTLEVNQHAEILAELQHDLQKRQSYLQYLTRFRQNLLLVMENVEQFEMRLRSESRTCNRHLLTVCVRLFLEKRQTRLQSFQEEFSLVTVSDDKIELFEEFIDSLMAELIVNGGILFGMPEWQVQEARYAIERVLLQRMYQQVMFPNEDADSSRDNVLSEHIRKLQRVIRPTHPALCIPQEYLSEAPWTFAQQQLSYISAYRTSREKLQCVRRCISSIMSLLHMSSGRTPAADDLLPVLIYVVIMANPPYLLSTVEYITCFIGEKMDGEEQFHWTIFGSVVKFIKTMDYLE